MFDGQFFFFPNMGNLFSTAPSKTLDLEKCHPLWIQDNDTTLDKSLRTKYDLIVQADTMVYATLTNNQDVVAEILEPFCPTKDNDDDDDLNEIIAKSSVLAFATPACFKSFLATQPVSFDVLQVMLSACAQTLQYKKVCMLLEQGAHPALGLYVFITSDSMCVNNMHCIAPYMEDVTLLPHETPAEWVDRVGLYIVQQIIKCEPGSVVTQGHHGVSVRRALAENSSGFRTRCPKAAAVLDKAVQNFRVHATAFLEAVLSPALALVVQDYLSNMSF